MLYTKPAESIPSEGLRIGHLDTGIDPESNPVLRGAIERFQYFDDEGHPSPAPPCDPSGHGSETAAVIRELAPECRFFSAAVINEGHIYTRILAGLEWMRHQPVSVLSMAIGIPVKSPIFERMLGMLVLRDVLIVVPSGNRGSGVTFTPAWSPHVLTVGAMEPDGTPAMYSSSVNVEDGTSLKPEIIAPTGNGARRGTSIASSRVAALAAVLRHRHPELSAADTRKLLLERTHPLSKEFFYKASHGGISPDLLIAQMS